MAFTPTSEIHLCSVPFSANYKNVISFSSTGNQTSYFLGLGGLTVTDYTYQRKDNIIRVGVNAESLWNVNYCCYKNENFGDKWFYAFVTKIEYINPNCTHLHIKTDVWQTWQFNYSFDMCRVLREHVEDDTVFRHTLPDWTPENPVMAGNTWSQLTPLVATGATWDWTFSGTNSADINRNFYLCLVCSAAPEGTAEDLIPAGFITGSISGLAYVICQCTVDDMRETLAAYAIAGKLDGIQNMFLIPKPIADSCNKTPVFSGSAYPAYIDTSSLSIDTLNAESWLSAWTGNLDDYTPQNNKCYCYPYNRLAVTNNDGSYKTYRYEQFTDPTNIHFRCYIDCCEGLTIGVCPVNYGGYGVQFYDNITLNNFQTVSSIGNTYSNYKALHASSLAMQTIGNVAQIGVGAATGNAGMAASGLTGIVNQAVQQTDMARQPDKQLGHTSSNLAAYAGYNNIYFRFEWYEREYIKQVDEYFTMYGYYVNEMKQPKIHTRPNWNYLQTQDCIINGNMPQDDLTELENMFNSGVTIWHSPGAFGNYSLQNK